MTGFDLDRSVGDGKVTGLANVNGQWGFHLPGTVRGVQITDGDSHDLQLTIRLDAAAATITAVLDEKPLYEWTGPIDSLSMWPEWSSTDKGRLAFGTLARGWEVSQVKLKRLQE